MHRGVIHALLAAALFGGSTPFAKLLLGDVHPVVLAGLLYAGSGMGLAIVQVLRVSFTRSAEHIAWPSRQDWGWLADAILIAGLKGIVAGVVNLSVALGLGYAMPSVDSIVQAASVGFFGYGLSLVLFVLALRNLGTARTGAYFAIAPFFGGLLAVLLL